MIITLCGSAKFENHFKHFNEVLTYAGHAVFSLAVYPSDKNGVQYWYDEAQKQRLDQAHFQKILASDAILVLNPLGYVGPSTLNEIWYATQHSKPIYCLESWAKGCGSAGSYPEYANRVVPAAFKGSPIDTTQYKHWSELLHMNGLSAGEIGNLLLKVQEFKERRYD